MSEYKDDHDCELVVSTKFANKLVNAYRYPLALELIHADQTAEVEAVAWQKAASPVPADETLDTDSDTLAFLTDDVMTPKRLAEQDSSVASESKRRKVVIKALTITINDAPTITLANPVQATGITLTINADLQIGVRLFGSWRMFNVHVQDAQLKGQQALLHLTADAGRIQVVPEFLKVQLTPKLRLLKWYYTFTIDITQQVNRHLRRKAPLDVITLPDLGLPNSDEKLLHVDNIAFKPHPQGLLLGVNFSFNDG